MPEPDRLEVGRIARAHGIRGEVIVEAVSNRPERFAAGSVLFAGEEELVVRRAAPHGGPDAAGRPARNRFIVAFEGVATRNEAEALRGTVLLGSVLDPDAGDELWVHDLVDAVVVDTTGAELGRVVAVEANPASDLLVLDGGGLVPLVFVVETGDGRVVVDPPPGLLEI